LADDSLSGDAARPYLLYATQISMTLEQAFKTVTVSLAVARPSSAIAYDARHPAPARQSGDDFLSSARIRRPMLPHLSTSTPVFTSTTLDLLPSLLIVQLLARLDIGLTFIWLVEVVYDPWLSNWAMSAPMSSTKQQDGLTTKNMALVLRSSTQS